jgi:hypothetical protein
MFAMSVPLRLARRCRLGAVMWTWLGAWQGIK